MVTRPGRVEGKVAIVTGAGSTPGPGVGTGKASAIVLAREGAKVVLVDIEPERADETHQVIADEGGEAIVMGVDATRAADCEAMVARAVDEFGHVDVLCNIGIYQGERDTGLFLDTPVEEFARHLEGGVLAPAVLLHAILPSMIERGGGTVLNMTSFVAVNDPPGTALENGWPLAYAATKAGIDRFAGVLNVELGDRGIRAYTVDPGFVAYGDEFDAMVERYVGMPVTPREAVAAAIVWLLSSPDAARLLHKRIYLPAIAQKYDLLPGWNGPGTPFPQ